MADLSTMSDEELLAIAGGGASPAASLSDEELLAIAGTGSAPTFGSEAAAVGGRFAQGLGDTADFINQVNPFAQGGPALWGLNPYAEGQPQPGAEITGAASALGLEGEPQTTAGKLAGGVAYYAPDLLFGGGLKGAVSVAAAGLSAGAADIFGAGEGGQALAGFGGGVTVPTLGSFIKTLTQGTAKQFQKLALKMGKGTHQATMKGLSRATKAAVLSGEELPVEQVIPIMKERGILKGSLKPSEMVSRNEGKIIQYAEEANNVLKNADAKGVKYVPDDIKLDATSEFLAKHEFAEPLLEQVKRRYKILSEGVDPSELPPGIDKSKVGKKWDGTLQGLNEKKKNLYLSAYKTAGDDKQLDRAIGHDIKTFIEQKAKAALGPEAMESLISANKKTGEHLQFFDILDKLRAEEANPTGIAKFLNRATESPIGLPAFGMAYGALYSNPGVAAAAALLAGLGTRRGKFIAADTLNKISKLATPFSGSTIPAIAGTIKQMNTDDFLSAMEEGFEKTFASNGSSSGDGMSLSESEPQKKNDTMREAPKNLQGLFQDTAAKVGLPAELLQAVAEQESNYDPSIKSHKGAVGLMQLMPRTAQEQAKKLGLEKYDLEDPEHSLLIGGSYLKRMIDMFDGDIKKGLTAYHSGAGNVQKGTLGPIGSVYAEQVLGRMNG